MADSEDTTTVAADQDTAAQPTDTDSGAQAEPSLDEVLASLDAEFEQATTEQPKPAEATADGDDSSKFVTREEFEALRAEQTSLDIDKAVATVKEAGVGASDRAVKAMLFQYADDMPKFRQAFDNRKRNPEGWSRALKAATKEIQKEFGSPVNDAVTQDREALAAAVRVTSSATSADDEAPDFAAMSDRDFERWKRSAR